MKQAKDYLAEATAAVPRIAPRMASKSMMAAAPSSRRSRQRGDRRNRHDPGALRIPRGFIEFAADDTTSFHNPALQKDGEIVIVCAAGGMAALTGKTLSDMGYECEECRRQRLDRAGGKTES